MLSNYDNGPREATGDALFDACAQFGSRRRRDTSQAAIVLIVVAVAVAVVVAARFMIAV